MYKFVLKSFLLQYFYIAFLPAREQQLINNAYVCFWLVCANENPKLSETAKQGRPGKGASTPSPKKKYFLNYIEFSYLKMTQEIENVCVF